MRDEILVVVGDPCTHGCPAARDMGCVAAGAAVDNVAVNPGFLSRRETSRRPRVDGADAGAAAARRVRSGLHRPCRRARTPGHLGNRGLRPVRPVALTVARVAGRSVRDDIAFCWRVAVLWPGRCCTEMHGLRCNRSSCSQAWCFRRRFVAASLSALAGSLLPRIVARIVAIVAWLGTLFSCSFKGVPVSPNGEACGSTSPPTRSRRRSSAAPRCSITLNLPRCPPRSEALALLVF